MTDATSAGDEAPRMPYAYELIGKWQRLYKDGREPTQEEIQDLLVASVVMLLDREQGRLFT